MKRLNPTTQKPFVRGDAREDGFLFCQYSTKIRKNGYFQEIWLKPESLKSVSKYNGGRNAAKRITERGRASVLLDAAVRRCTLKNNGAVTITKDWIENKLIAGVCELTGLPFDLNPCTKSRTNPYSPSLDRIDNNNTDYSPENTRVVLSCVNIAINDYGLDVVLPIMRALVAKQVTP